MTILPTRESKQSLERVAVRPVSLACTKVPSQPYVDLISMPSSLVYLFYSLILSLPAITVPTPKMLFLRKKETECSVPFLDVAAQSESTSLFLSFKYVKRRINEVYPQPFHWECFVSFTQWILEGVLEV